MEPLRLLARWCSENNQSTTVLCLTSKTFSDVVTYQFNLRDIPENNWRYYVEQYGANMKALLFFVASQGNLSFFKELTQTSMRMLRDFVLHWLSEAFRVAAKNGHIPILEWIFKEGHVGTDMIWIYEIAATTGPVDVLQWLRDNNFILGFPINLVQEALTYEQIPVLEWTFTTFSNDLEFDRCDYKLLLQWAAEQNKLQVAKWAINKNTQPLRPLKFVCSSQFNQDTIHYCQERGAPWIIEIRPELISRKFAAAEPTNVN